MVSSGSLVGRSRSTKQHNRGMTIRIGYVGVGKWALQLESVFRQHALTRGFCRKSQTDKITDYQGLGEYSAIENFGPRFETYQGLASCSDLVVVAADPKTTTEVALYCAENCIPCVATKPLLEHPQLIGAPFFVDFWRLYSAPFAVFRSQVIGPVSCEIDFVGNGPFRETIDGLDDWGPHAFSFANSLLGARVETLAGARARNVPCEKGVIFELRAKVGDIDLTVRTGNGAPAPMKQIRVRDWYSNHIFFETSEGVIDYRKYSNGKESVLRSNKNNALRSFAQMCVNSVESFQKEQDAMTNLVISEEASKMVAFTRELASRVSPQN